MSTSKNKGTGAVAKKEEANKTYNIRDIVLGKIRGFPPWPGMVVDPASVPTRVQRERPQKQKVPFYCVQFFPVGDFAWLVAKDISKLQVHEIQSYITEPHKKSGELLTAYKTALDPTPWEASIQEQLEKLEKLAEDEDESVDQILESEGEDADGDDVNDGEKKKKSSKKRKRESDVDGTTKKSSGTGKAKALKKEKDASGTPANSKKAAKRGKNGAKSKAMVESEDEGDDDAAPTSGKKGAKEKDTPPPNKKAKRDKEDDEVDDALSGDPEAQKVREWRHKLQKTFLGKSTPKDEDMPGVDQLFQTVESYDQMEYRYLQFSKIGKVMRHIALLTPESAPRDEEFQFRTRAQKLVDKWQHMYGAAKKGSTAPPPTTPMNGKEEVNGKDYAMASPSTPAAAVVVDATPMVADATMADIGQGDISLADVTMSDIGVGAA